MAKDVQNPIDTIGKMARDTTLKLEFADED
jgi:hypothetical protein